MSFLQSISLILLFFHFGLQISVAQETKGSVSIEEENQRSTWRPFTLELTSMNIASGFQLESTNLAYGITIEKEARKDLYLRATAISDFNVMGPGFKFNMGVLNTIFNLGKIKFRTGIEIGIKSAVDLGVLFSVRRSSGVIEMPFLLNVPLFDQVSLDVGFRSAVGPFDQIGGIFNNVRFNLLDSYNLGVRYTFLV